MTSIIKANYARMIQGFLSKEETRYYLSGFCLEASNTGWQIIATNGHILGCFHDETAIMDQGMNGTIWKLPAHILKECKPAKRDDGERFLVWEATDRSSVFTVAVVLGDCVQSALARWEQRHLESIKVEATVTPIDGTFPDWRRVVPQSPFGPVDESYNFDLLVPFSEIDDGKQIKLSGGDHNSALLVRNNRPDFFGVLMPMRNTVPDGLPDWLNPVNEESKAV